VNAPARKLLAAAGLAAGLAAHSWLGGLAIRAQSATFDEPLHLTAGQVYWRTRDYRLNGLHHPPLSSLTAAAPLLALDAPLPLDHPLWLRPRWHSAANQYAFANAFLYHTPGFSEDRLLTAGRAAMLACSLIFLLCLWGAANAAFGPVAAWSAFALGSLSPELLAHGTLVTTDFLFSAFFFLFFCVLARWEKSAREGGRPSLWAAETGGAAGFAFAGKFSAVLIGPALVAWLFLRRFRPRKAEVPHGSGRPRLGWRPFAVAAGAAALALALAYQFTGLPLFFSGLEFTMGRVQEGRSSFLLGRHSAEGWWHYFPVVFWLKTSPVLLAGLAAAALLAARRKWRPPWHLVLPPAVYFAAACASSVQIGHRHILPVYPFLYVLAGGAAARLWSARWAKPALAAAGILLAADVWTSRPFFLSYFNPLSGARERPYDFVTDSNTDWGQGLRELRRYLDEHGVGAVHLSYFGTAEPEAHGVRHAAVAPYTIPLFAGEDVDFSTEPRELLVVSATNYRSTYFADKALFAWLESRAPAAFLAGSLLVFDVTADAESQERLAGIYERTGRDGLAQRARARAARLRQGAVS
jgi:hypothetical protein